MLQVIKQLAISLVLSVGLISPLAVPAMVYAAEEGDVIETTPEIEESLCEGANLTVGGSEDCDAGGDGTVAETANSFIAKIINIFSLVVGVAAVIMIIFGGFKYITSGGNDQSVSGAKNTILYAIIGLVIVALAQFIVKFVLERATAAA